MILLLWGVLSAGGAAGEMPLRTIVLDPGHGGGDHGVQGAGGVSEKTVTLMLARMLSHALEGRYRVILTRSEDVGADAFQRTARANHLRADLFVSLHAGGGFVRGSGGSALFYFEKKTAASARPDTSTAFWQDIQHKHQSASRSLAREIGYRLSAIPGFAESRIYGAPVAVLQGADMPAILIEIGNLSHPAQEKKFQDSQMLSDVVREMAQGIRDFFSKKSE